MMMSTSQINMAHHVHYVVAIITPPNIVLRESIINEIMEKMNISGHQSQPSGYIPKGEHDDPSELPQQQDFRGFHRNRAHSIFTYS